MRITKEIFINGSYSFILVSRRCKINLKTVTYNCGTIMWFWNNVALVVRHCFVLT